MTFLELVELAHTGVYYGPSNARIHLWRDEIEALLRMLNESGRRELAAMSVEELLKLGRLP